MNRQNFCYFIGIDISKKFFDVAIIENEKADESSQRIRTPKKVNTKSNKLYKKIKR